MSLPQFAELHVISDLHMGGRKGFQILRETDRLAAYIDWVAQQQPEKQLALVLNGDVIDTLAEEDVDYIATTNAVAVVQRIMSDPAFVPIWNSLADFVGTSNRHLVIILGNHDLELSFPLVQNSIIDRLATNDTERGRITFSTMGGGFTCLVGDKRVFCTHGNEVDDWNFTRYEELAKAARRLNCGRSFASGEWKPCAGTRLVKEVMNQLKGDYPWIDLLKPETKAALGVLIALDPQQLKKIKDALPVVAQKTIDSFQVDNRLSVDTVVEPGVADLQVFDLDNLLGPNLKESVIKAGGGRPVVEELLLMAEQEFEDFNPEEETPEQTLGWWQLIYDKVTSIFTGISDAEALRKALCDWLEGDRSFDLGDQDEISTKLLESIGCDIDYVVAGHTHLERAIKLGGGRYYFNSGTWIRLLRFTQEMLADETSFAPVYQLLKCCTYTQLDQAAFGGKDFILDQCSAVCIKEENGQVKGDLYHIKLMPGGAVKAEPVPGQ